ncbi:hypothetical protein L2E82_30615 [Cichorium intybus]|uniref:Uncharacterized protein n=1 Tax=Cichorium intybus TaxID=13427 RepID=A0ACB9D0V6_CICIN|nr:hypothetical protein L2E82_30615 [Cichorium intybus]
MLVSFLMGLNMSLTAIKAALALVVLDFKDAGPCLEKVSYSLLVFFCGMFVTVDGFNRTGIPSAVWDFMEQHAQIDHISGVAFLRFCVGVSHKQNGSYNGYKFELLVLKQRIALVSRKKLIVVSVLNLNLRRSCTSVTPYLNAISDLPDVADYAMTIVDELSTNNYKGLFLRAFVRPILDSFESSKEVPQPALSDVRRNLDQAKKLLQALIKVIFAGILQNRLFCKTNKKGPTYKKKICAEHGLLLV